MLLIFVTKMYILVHHMTPGFVVHNVSKLCVEVSVVKWPKFHRVIDILCTYAECAMLVFLFSTLCCLDM